MLSKSHQQSEPAIYYCLTNGPSKEASNSNHFICHARDMGKPGFQIRVAKSCAGMAAIFSNTLFVCSPGLTPTRGFGLWVSNEVAGMTWSEVAVQAHARTVSSQLHPSLSNEWPNIHHVANSIPHNHCLREEACKVTSLQSYRFKSTNPAYL